MPINEESATVLCIEDEANIADVIKASLAYGGFKVVTAATAAEGLEMAQTCRPELILLDLILPDINGYSFFDLLQESGLSHNSRRDRERLCVSRSSGIGTAAGRV